MLVGYARTSTVEQEAGFEAQLKELQDLGFEKIFREQVYAGIRPINPVSATADIAKSTSN